MQRIRLGSIRGSLTRLRQRRYDDVARGWRPEVPAQIGSIQGNDWAADHLVTELGPRVARWPVVPPVGESW